MGASAENGVVNHLGEVFGYPNLIVADGASIPTSTGRNPSHTIAAMAERIAAHMV
jgi:cholesterol oxidase